MDLLAREQDAERNVVYQLKATSEPIANLLHAFNEYRHAWRELVFANYDANVPQKERSLWQRHTEAKKYFHNALSGVRKQSGHQHVATRQLTKFYMQYIKDSQRFYREYIHLLNTTFGGIAELEAVAHQVKIDAVGESSRASVSPELRQQVLESCHQSLIYLGDLSRYRAFEKLDRTPDFGPAIGYYSLACTLMPTSGMGHHQLAVVALAQAQHLPTIHHLYRAMVVEQPHPNAPMNLKLEFEKTKTAWEKGELIQKTSVTTADTARRTLVGWFIRLHSVCFDGEPVRGFSELESEVLGQLATELKARPLGSSLMRIVMVNLSAQYNAAENFQKHPSEQNQNAFLHFFRINIKTFVTLLRIFHEELSGADINNAPDDDDDEGFAHLAARLSEAARRVLPVIRLYSGWLLSMIHLLNGLITQDLLKEAINQLWRQYARMVDLVAAVFPIWDLEDLSEIPYLLEEDAETIAFKPLEHKRTTRIWNDKATGNLRPRFSDMGVVRATADEEMLARVKQFLVDGLFLANDDPDAPIKLRGTRILHRDAEDVEVLPFTPLKPPAVVQAKPAPKPLSYAAAAANGANSRVPKTSPNPKRVTERTDTASKDVQLSRMVDDLVDDNDSNHPITPPQQHAANPAVVTKSDVSYAERSGGGKGFAQVPSHSYPYKPPPIGTPATPSSPSYRTPSHVNVIPGLGMDRLQSFSSIWNDAAGASSPSSFPNGLPTGTLASPAHLTSRGHSRLNSASSIRSQGSQNVNMHLVDSVASLDSPSTHVGAASATAAAAFGSGRTSFDQSYVPSPLLFGAGGGVWSSRHPAGGRNGTPPSGQGG